MIHLHSNFKKWLREVSHPSEKDLFLYREGELEKRTAERIRQHVQVCWSCSAKTEEFGQSIHLIMQHRNRFFAPRFSFPPAGQRRFAAKLSRASEMRGRGLDLFSRLSHGRMRVLRISSLGLVCGLLILLTVQFSWLRLSSPPTVSAKEVLLHAENAQKETELNPNTPIVYQKLRVRRSMPLPRRDAVVTWEIWNDSIHSRFLQRVEDENGLRFIEPKPEIEKQGGRPEIGASNSAILAELEEIYRVNGMNFRRPLSLHAQPSWRESIRQDSVGVRETRLSDGQMAVWLTKSIREPVSQNHLLKAEMLVRSTDWRPIEHRLRVQGERETPDYELRELGFDLLASNSVPTPFLSKPSAIRAETFSVPTPPTKVASGTELLEAQIMAHHALHRIKACLGEQVEVIPGESGRIGVRGVVESAQRKEELFDALSDIPHVEVRVRLSDEEENRELPSSVDLPNTLVQPKRLPIEDSLEEFFTEHPEFRVSLEEDPGLTVRQRKLAYINKAILTTDAAMAQAWALRRLSDSFLSEKLRELRVPYSWMLPDMLDDHLKELKQQVEIMKALLQPILSRVGSEYSQQDRRYEGESAHLEVRTPKNMTGTAALFAEVKNIEELTLGIFSDHGSKTAVLQRDAQTLLSAVVELEGNIEQHWKEVSQEFSEKRHSLVSGERAE